MALRSSGTCCAARGCTNNQTKLNLWLQQRCFQHGPKTKQQCSCEKRYSFHRMPTDDESKRMWLKNLNLKRPPKTVYVCSFHFVDKKPTEENPYPALWLGHDQTPEKRRRIQVFKDVQQLVRIKEEEQRPDVDQQDPEPVHIKKEEEEEQLNRTITTDVSEFGFTAHPLKSEDDEDKPFPQLYVHKMEDREILPSTSADPVKASEGEEDFTEIEITWDPDRLDSFSSEVEDLDEDEDSDSLLSYSSDSGPTSDDSDWTESMASTSGVKTVISSDTTSRSTRLCKRKPTESYRLGILDTTPTFWGDHNYAKVVLTFNKSKTS